MILRDKKIFLSGGAGFIGTKIIQRLVNDNEIVVFDTFQRNSLKDYDFANHPNLELIKGTVLDKEQVSSAIQGSNAILHLAAIAGIDTVIKSPTNTMTVNFVGTSNVLEAAKKLGTVERFIDFSTSEVYGSYAYKMGEHNCTTMGAVGAARWTYAISKLAAEHLAHGYYEEFNLPVVSIRPFNIYGPGQIGEGAIHSFIVRALDGQDLIIHGEGDQIRSWCYIDDMVDGIMLCLENDRAVGHVFNMGNPKGTTTILSLAEKIVGISNSPSQITFVQKPYVDVELRIPDIEKSKSILNFNPKVDLNTGLRRTIQWYTLRKFP